MAAFTTIATLGAAAIGSGMSFAEAGKQRKLQSQAEAAAQKAFDEAKAKLDVNYLEGLTIAKEPYELEREALAQAGASALQAGIEGDQRGAGATAGRVLMAQQAQQAQQRAGMSREMQALNQIAAQEESRLQGARVELDLGEAKGQSQRAQQAQQARASAMNAGIGGLFKIAAAGIESGDLYKSAKPVDAVAGVTAPSALGASTNDILTGNFNKSNVTFDQIMNRDLGMTPQLNLIKYGTNNPFDIFTNN